MPDQADISIIIPVFNGAKYIKKCLDSLLNQELKPREIIVVDNGSTDDDGRLLKIVDDLLEVMLAINREGVTLLVVEQDVHTALIYANRGYVLSEGLIVKSAQAKTLIADPSIRKEYLGI